MYSKTIAPRRRALVLAVGALTALPALLTGPSAQAARARPAAEKTVSTAAPVSAEAWAVGRAKRGSKVTAAQAVQAYWTPTRMRKAKRVEESFAYRTAVARHEKLQKQQLTRFKGGEKPDAVTPADPHAVKPTGGTATAPSSVRAAADPGFDAWRPTASTSGKVFFSMGGSNYVCSGTVVNSEGKNSVWTAGHCVHGGRGGAWASNWTFVPAYDDDLANPRPYGTWTAGQLWSMTAWTSRSDFSADLGVAVMSPLGGQRIANQLGGQGLRTGAGKNVFENAFGYPAEWPFDGGNLFRCSGKSSPEWSFLFWSSETIKIPCDLTRGSSGGGWFNGWNGDWGYLNGVNSRIDRIVNPTIMLSPYFDDTAWSLYGATRHL
ncbi:MAG: hypothetical protein GXX79_12940 [Actinomycetales bacterium]|nr:hypothetical protein [Actinomycetales bacterium]